MEKFYTFCILFITACSVRAQTTSASFDTPLAAALQHSLDSVVEANGIQGVSCAAYVPGQGTWIGVAGESYPGQVITADMRFNEASQSKGMVAVVILKLQELGILSVEDQLDDWLPSYPFIDSSITIQQLLTQETGLYDFINENFSLYDSIFEDYTRSWTPEELLLQFMDAPHFPTGTSYSYSNTNFTLAGMIIEAATGLSLAEALHLYIWDPIGMDSTYYAPQEDPIGTFAHNWEYGTDYTTIPATAYNSISFGCAGVVSTASEMMSWYKNLFEGNIISLSSLAQMTAYDHLYFYGFGIYGYSYTGSPIHSHDGSWIGTNSLTMYDSKTHWIIALSVNARPDSPFGIADALHAVLRGNLPEKTNDAAIVKINAPSGNYCSDGLIPEVILKNAGTEMLSSVAIHYGIEGAADMIFNWTGSLATDAEEVITLPEITAGVDGQYIFYAKAEQANAADDGYTENDGIQMNFNMRTSPVVSMPYYEGFENGIHLPENWLILQPDHLFTWGVTNLAGKTGSGSLVKNNYSDIDVGGLFDVETPVIDLSDAGDATLSFELAYKNYPDYYDSLQIFISKDCGISYESIFYAGGESLASGSLVTFFEANAGNFHQHSIDLLTYAGEQVIIKFRIINGWSNCMFIDDVAIDGTLLSVDTFPEAAFATVFPNPVRDLAAIRFSAPLSNAALIVCDISGKKVKTLQGISGNVVSLATADLPAGHYFFSILENAAITAHGKFIVQ